MKIELDLSTYCVQLPTLARTQRIFMLIVILLVVVSRGEAALFRALLT